MSPRTIGLDDTLYAYLLEHGVRESAIAAELRETTQARTDGRMQISPEQGAFLAMLVRIMGARRILEVGTFTGYSALWMANAMPDDGEMIACDVNPDTTAIGRKAWRRAGVDHRIDLRIAPALETLSALIADGQEGTFDLAFLDADKTGYETYVHQCHRLVRPGGVVAIDNVLWSGSVADPNATGDDTMALKALNEALRHDERWDLSMLPIGDGLTLLRRR